MWRPASVILLGLLTSACQMRTTPQDYSASFDMKDKKFNTADCRAQREKAQSYEINYAPAILLAGPIGGIYMTIEDKRRYEVLRALHTACSSQPAPEAWDWPLRQTKS